MPGPVVVVRIAGTPFTINDLRPDAALMQVTAALRAAGNHVSPTDAGNFETFEMLYPPEAQGDTYDWALKQPADTLPGLFGAGTADFPLPTRLRKRHNAVYERLGERLVARQDPGAVFFAIHGRKDLQPSLLAAARVRAMRPRARVFAFGTGVDDDYVLSRALRTFDAVLLCPSVAARLHEAPFQRDWRGIPNLAYYEGPQLVLTTRSLSDAECPELERSLYIRGAEYSKIRVFDIFAFSGVRVGSMDTGDSTGHAGNIAAIRRMAEAFSSHACCIRPGPDGSPGLERALLSSGLRISYTTIVDPAETPRTRLGLLSASGCVAIDIPVCSGSQRLLDTHYKKNYTVTQVERLARAARFSGLFTSAHFTFPCSEDDYHTEDETLRLVRRAGPSSAVVSEPDTAGARGAGPLALEFAPLRRRARAKARKQCVELRRKIREQNVSCGINATTALLAGLAGFRGRESAFVDLAGLQLLSGDATGLAETIEQINDSARQPARAIAFKALNLAQNAAAN